LNNVYYYKGNKKQEISVEVLRSEIAQLLQIDNLSFLIGAGCSSHVIDNAEVGIPGMKTLYDNFFDENPNFEIAGVRLLGKFDRNLEKVIEALSAVQVVNQIREIDDQANEKMKMIRNYLRRRIVEGLPCSDVKEIYKNFYAKIAQKTRKSPISVFTTNYERKFSPDNYNYVYVENMNLSHDVWERVSTFFNLVKLHGSISWIRKDEQIWERDYETVSDGDTVMIYPTPLKDRTTLMTPYSDLFRAMENRIMQKNSVLIVMGYSFGDDHINRLILNALAVTSFHLVVFGLGDGIDRLIKIGDPRISVINSDDKIHYFNNIIEQVLPNVHPDVSEKLKTHSTNQLISETE
jgi:hypothetical protein